MTKLVEILGKAPTSPEATEILRKYPNLRLQVDEGEADNDEDPVRYLRSDGDGLLIKLSAEGEIVTIFLMSEGKDGFSEFPHQLPGGLTFESTARDALKKLGAPAYSRAPGRVGSYEMGELLRFDWPAHSVHFQFRPGDGGIDLVTIMVARAVPGRSHAQLPGHR